MVVGTARCASLSRKFRQRHHPIFMMLTMTVKPPFPSPVQAVGAVFHLKQHAIGILLQNLAGDHGPILKDDPIGFEQGCKSETPCGQKCKKPAPIDSLFLLDEYFLGKVESPVNGNSPASLGLSSAIPARPFESPFHYRSRVRRIIKRRVANL